MLLERIYIYMYSSLSIKFYFDSFISLLRDLECRKRNCFCIELLCVVFPFQVGASQIFSKVLYRNHIHMDKFHVPCHKFLLFMV
ncbi:hypothetical protein A4A49_57893 [Nicotiana attenuata]|uniref:Uncharacterized protein n=1 Tax=Nicotiana attenuata TaxID=49451 RepID=A0A314L650_NICAT|nr:hypothetical protein A4A49_57893 [Nicotiana attenuata]